MYVANVIAEICAKNLKLNQKLLIEVIPINRYYLFALSREVISAGSLQGQCYKLLIDSVPRQIKLISDDRQHQEPHYAASTIVLFD